MLIKKAVYLERSPAKINLYLDILGERDDGYHNIETLFQAINLEDNLTFEISIQCAENEEERGEAIDFEIGIDSNNKELKSLGLSNSVTKAIETYFAEVPQDQVIDLISSVSIDVFIDKNIPMQAGLAGGSANAAATLRVLNKFFEENFNWSLSSKELLEVAAQVGSDVPFCLESLVSPRIFAESRGEVFSDRTIDFDFDQFNQVIVIKPDFGIPTAEAYKLFSKNKNKITKPKGIEFFNAFEALLFDEYPELHQLRDALLKAGCDYALLSGSGSAVLGFTKNQEVLVSVYENFEKNFKNCKIFKANFLH